MPWFKHLRKCSVSCIFSTYLSLYPEGPLVGNSESEGITTSPSYKPALPWYCSTVWPRNKFLISLQIVTHKVSCFPKQDFYCWKKRDPPYSFLEIMLCIRVQQHKTTIPATFSQASLPFHSGTESDREQKAIRTVCSRTLFPFSFLDFEWLFLFIWNPINSFLSFCNYSFTLRLWKVLPGVCVCALQCPFSGGVF